MGKIILLRFWKWMNKVFATCLHNLKYQKNRSLLVAKQKERFF